MSETFGQRLRRLREAKGWTHEELQQRLLPGSSGNVIKLFESDCPTWNPPVFTIKTIMRFADILGVSVGYLFDGDTPSDAWANTPGKRIRARRDELGWDFEECYKEFAEEGLSPHSLLEADAKGYAGEDMIDSIADHLGVNVEWILTGAEPKFPPKPIQHPLYKEFSTSYWYGEGDTMDVCFRVRCDKADRERIVEALRFGRAIE